MEIIWLPHPGNTNHWLLGYADGKLFAEITCESDGPRDVPSWGLKFHKISGFTGKVSGPEDNGDKAVAAKCKERLKKIAESALPF